MKTLRALKKKSQNAAWGALTPAQRLAKAAELTEAALKLRSAGLAHLGVSQDSVERAKRRGRG